MYIPQQKILFVHAPKTGGTSIRNWLTNNTNAHPLKAAKHYSKENILKKFNSIEVNFSFAVVRNPWDYAVSWYFFNRDRALRRLDSPKQKGKYSNEYNLHVLSEFDKGIEYYLTNFNKKPLSLTTKDVNYILKLETIDQDFKKIQDIFQCYTPLDHLNKSNRKKDYRQYYNDKTKNIIAERFREDINVFKYTF